MRGRKRNYTNAKFEGKKIKSDYSWQGEAKKTTLEI